MRTKVCKLLKQWDAQAVENRVGPGMPDIVLTTNGVWIETKKTKAFPKRAGTPVVLDHELLMTQRVWLRRCSRKGGRCYVLTQVANEFFLHNGEWAAEHLGKVDRTTLTVEAEIHCEGWKALARDLPQYLNES